MSTLFNALLGKSSSLKHDIPEKSAIVLYHNLEGRVQAGALFHVSVA
jgi:hypothetical protein